MRNWRGNRRYLVLVVALTGGVLATILAAVAALGPRWAVPHMLPLGVLVAIEALLTQRLVRQARQTWTEQWPRRLLEWAVLLLVIRGWSLAASPRPFWATITPWLRDPVAAFDMRFLAYCMLSFMCWAIATALGGEVWRWTAERAADVVARDTIERGHLDEERAEVMRRFDQRLATLVGVAVVCALWALRGESGGLALLGRGAGLAVGGVWVTIGCAFALHSAAKLNQLYDGWCSDNVVIETGVMRRWSRGSGLLVGLLIVLGPLLGLVTLVTPPPPLAPLFAALVFLVGVMYAIALLPSASCCFRSRCC